MKLPNFLRQRLLNRYLKTCSSREPDFQIGRSGDVYLTRWWLSVTPGLRSLIRRCVKTEDLARRIITWLGRNPVLCVYLHRGQRDDEDRAHHCHPGFSISIVLKPYIEITPKGKFLREAGQIIFRTPWARHRLVMLRDDAGNIQESLSIFIFYLKLWHWGFYCPKGYVPWEEFTKKGNPGEIGQGCGEYS